MEVKPIKTKRDYEATLKAIERLMGAKRDSPEGDRLDVLVTLVEAYVMEQRGLSVKDLVPFIGQPNRVYEILSHRRPLTMAMAWKLHRGLGIPAESLIRQAA